LAEERPFAMDRIEGFRLLAADARAPLRDDTQARALDRGVDRTGQIAGGGIGFDDRKVSSIGIGWVFKEGKARAPIGEAYSDRAPARQGMRRAVAATRGGAPAPTGPKTTAAGDLIRGPSLAPRIRRSFFIEAPLNPTDRSLD